MRHRCRLCMMLLWVPYGKLPLQGEDARGCIFFKFDRDLTVLLINHTLEIQVDVFESPERSSSFKFTDIYKKIIAIACWKYQHTMLNPLSVKLSEIFTHLKLCLATAIHNFKWVKIYHSCLIWDQTSAWLTSSVRGPSLSVGLKTFVFKWSGNSQLRHWLIQSEINPLVSIPNNIPNKTDYTHYSSD